MLIDHLSPRSYGRKKAEKPEEHLELICEELSQVDKQRDGRVRVDTLKSYVAALLQHGKDVEQRKKTERDAAEGMTKIVHGFVGLVALLLAAVGGRGGSPGEWLYEYEFAIRIWAIAFSAIYVGIAVERTPLASRLWGFGCTKIAFSIALSALIVVSTAKASTLLNAVFGVDASALPYARAILAAFWGVKFVYPLLFLLVPFMVWHLWEVVKTLRNDGLSTLPVYSFVTALLSFLVFAMVLRWATVEFSDDALPSKAFILGHELDFRAQNRCANLEKEASVLYIGEEQTTVLVDFSGMGESSLEAFVRSRPRTAEELRRHLVLMKCEMPPPRETQITGFPFS